MITALRLRQPRFWFVSDLVLALLTIGFAFTVVGLIAEAATLVCLLTGTTMVIAAHRRP